MSKHILLLAVASLALSGCYSFEMSRIGKRVGQDVERQTGADVGGGLSMGIGPVSLATAQFGAWAFAPNSTREARQIGRHVSSVKFSRRSIRGGFDGRIIERPAYLDRYERGGWYTFASFRDSTSAAWVMLREQGHDDQITNLLAIVVSEEDLVLTKVSGNLSNMIREAIELGTQEGLLGDALEEAGLIEPVEDAVDVTADEVDELIQETETVVVDVHPLN